eukprot:8235805-Alexandrium_andersonii.AAC.1
MAGEDGGADMGADDDEDSALLEDAPKRSRPGERAIRRRPKPAPSGPSAEARPGDSSAGASAKNPCAEPTE